MILYPPDHPLVLNGTYDQEGYKPGERARIAKAKLRMAKADASSPKETRPMHKLFDVGKVGLWCDTIGHSSEKRKDGEVKVIVLTLRVQPFDAALAAALHPDVRTTLFRLSHPDPHPHLARVSFELGVPRQALDIYATPETVKATMRLDHVKIAGIYARTESGVGGYACVLKAIFGPVSDKELGFCEAWRKGMKFVSFEEAEPSAEFEEQVPEAEPDEDDDGPDDGQPPLLPPAEFETDPDGRPLEASTATDASPRLRKGR
jgi:hypothetical protein